MMDNVDYICVLLSAQSDCLDNWLDLTTLVNHKQQQTKQAKQWDTWRSAAEEPSIQQRAASEHHMETSSSRLDEIKQQRSKLFVVVVDSCMKCRPQPGLCMKCKLEPEKHEFPEGDGETAHLDKSKSSGPIVLCWCVGTICHLFCYTSE